MPKIRILILDACMHKRYIVDGVKMQSAFEYAKNRTQTKTAYPNYWE